MKIYVASSWRNDFQPEVVAALREDGHEVYDFKDSEGFHWSEVDPDWKDWTIDIPQYLKGLTHPCAERGFNRDMTALRECDACVYVMPCGVSASLEAGWAAGAGKPVIVYVPGLREPDLMVKMADIVTDNMEEVRTVLKRLADVPQIRMKLAEVAFKKALYSAGAASWAAHVAAGHENAGETMAAADRATKALDDAKAALAAAGGRTD